MERGEPESEAARHPPALVVEREPQLAQLIPAVYSLWRERELRQPPTAPFDESIPDEAALVPSGEGDS